MNVLRTQLRRTLARPPTARAMSSSSQLPKDASLPGEHFAVRQTASSDDYQPDPSRSIKLSPARQALLDDVLALYSCQPTRRRVERYTPDCVYDDQFVYANDRYKMAGQWFALPKLFASSKNEAYEVVTNDPLLIQFKNEQARLPFPTRVFRRSLTPSRPSRRGRSQGISSPLLSTPSSPFPSTPPLPTPTFLRSSITRTRRIIRTTPIPARVSHSRSGKPTRFRE